MILRVPVSRTLKPKTRTNFILVGEAWVDCPYGHPAAGAMAAAVAISKGASRSFRTQLIKSLEHLQHDAPTLEMLEAYDMFNTPLDTEEDAT